MKTAHLEATGEPDARVDNQWLASYYFSRAVVSFTWVGAALSLGVAVSGIAAVLLIFYPAWDAAANLLDAHRNRRLKRNASQVINVVVSAITTIAIAIALDSSMNAVLGVFGTWAVMAGLLQLATAARRWKIYGAQWIMILSGAQSALAGGFFIKQANSAGLHGIAEIAPYVAFGAFYFLISALWLVVVEARRRKVRAMSAG